MSVRIHQLSKKIGLDNKQLIDLLRERGFNVTSASSTVDNISAESLEKEFGGKKPVEKSEAPEKPSVSAEPEELPTVPPPPPPAIIPPPPPPAPLPAGVFVKTKEQVATEREARKPPPPLIHPPRQPVNRPTMPPRVGAPPPRPAPVPASSPPPVPAASPPAPPRVPSPAGQRPPVRPGAGAPPPLAPPTPPPVQREPRLPVPTPSDTSKDPASEQGAEKKSIQVKPPIVLREFAKQLGLMPFKLISELMEMGIFASMNMSLEEDVALRLAERHGFALEIRHRGDAQAAVPPKKEKPKIDESLLMESRPPVVCILGHVDHGKTTLLDKIRSANVVATEAGGITQHIGAYQVEKNGQRITFLDTPGHAAFNKMRARGAGVTDIAILVVAADDGFMPQTDEALKYISEAGVTPIVAINKIDTKGANIDRVKTQMNERNLMPEDYGGEIITVPVSAIKGEGIDSLLEMILLQADVLELKANPKKPSSGVVIEAQIEQGRGPTATVLVQSGTLKVGDALLCGQVYTKVKALFDSSGASIKQAGPSTPVRIIGWSDTPECGATYETVKNDRVAKELAEEYAFEQKKKALAPVDKPAATMENLFAAIAATQNKTLRLVVKGDVYGSVEAVVDALFGIKSEKVSLEVVDSDVGLITRNDVLTASAAEAMIIGFNVKLESGVEAVAKHHGVKIVQHRIIYELVQNVRDLMADLLDPEYRETKLGAAEVRKVFPVAKGFVAGCLVTEGRVEINQNARLFRGKTQVFMGKVSGLRRVKDEVKEVRAGTECGISLLNCKEYQEGDVIEIFTVETLRPSL